MEAWREKIQGLLLLRSLELPLFLPAQDPTSWSQIPPSL